MESLGGLLLVVQLVFVIVIGSYFWTMLRQQQNSRTSIERESVKQKEKLTKLRKISLSDPLAERTRPSSLTEVIGQKEGIKALRAALCGPNPQHILLYGPPGVGKTAAARLVLKEAVQNPLSPFTPEAKFIELDGATARFDERGIADPLIGSVHDPIYQGAGAMGMAGIPQPKMGAVTKAHGGVLFIDEIGELHPIQINKLLKVLEDRKVLLESSYYSTEDHNIPEHIHDIFQNGLPADFRMIGATTRSPEEISPAIRSRCMEIFFRSLLPDDITIIARNAACKVPIEISEEALAVIQKYATNGREAVNMVQLAAGVAINEGKQAIQGEMIEWVVTTGQYTPRPEKKIPLKPQVGVVNGLAIYGANLGMLLEMEVTAYPALHGKGELHVTGIVEEEESGSEGRKIKRKSMARSSIENVLTVLRREYKVDPHQYDIHVNFPGGIPLDGPSAGITMATAILSAIRKRKVDNQVAMTGELSIHGKVKPVGGVSAKIEAAIQAGCSRIFIPRENWQSRYALLPAGVEVIPVDTLAEVLRAVLLPAGRRKKVEVDLSQGEAALYQALGEIKRPFVNLPEHAEPC